MGMRINELSGPSLKALRESLGLSREKLSERSGLPVRTIQDIEQEIVRNPGLKNIQAMVKGLDLVVDVGEIKPLSSTISQMTDDELETLIDLVMNELKARKRKEFDRLKAMERHLRSFGDDFFEALMDLDQYKAIGARPGLGLLEPESQVPVSSTDRSSSTATRAQPIAPLEKRRRVGRD